MSTFQAAFLNEVIYVTNARFKESKEGCSLAAQGDWRPRQGSCWKIYKEGLKRKINAFEGNHPTSIVERPIGPVKVSFLTKLRKTGFAATRMPFLISQRQDLQQSPTTLRESTRLACWHVRENRSLRWQDLPLEPYGSDGWSHYSFECLLRLALERGTSTAKVLKPKTRRTYFGNLNESIPTWPILLTALASSDTATEILPTSLSEAGL